MKENELIVSTLGKTWLFDLDGTLVKHNGHLEDGYDTLLDGVKEFFASISNKDKVIILTSRNREFNNKTEEFLTSNGIRFDHIIYDLPYGERILINDQKPSGLRTAVAINIKRDSPFIVEFSEDTTL